MHDFGVGIKKEKRLLEKMFLLGIREADLAESFVRSSGPGGQNINKTSTCVCLKHIPTQVEVKCQKERTQALNRYIARVLLVKKIETLIHKRELEEKQRVEKLRRQKNRRPMRIRLKILEEKRKHSQKKSLRAKVRDFE